jgi:hypothetical protein
MLLGENLTAAGQMLVIAIVSALPSRSKSIASPMVNTDMPTLPIAYAVLPRKKRLYTGGLTTTILPAPILPSPLRYRCGSTACTIPYRPSMFTRCMSWNRFIGVCATLDHQIAPLLYTRTSMRP